MKDKRTYIHHKEHGEDISHENEVVIDFVEAKTDDTVNKLRNNIRDLLSMNTQYKKELAVLIDEIENKKSIVLDLSDQIKNDEAYHIEKTLHNQ